MVFKAMNIRSRLRTRGRSGVFLVVAGMICVMAGVLWYSYPREVAEQEIMAAPIIRADAGPFKVIPRDPGGMDIPYRDSTVFETLRAARETGEGRIESLLPEAEEPLRRDQLFAGLKTDMDEKPVALEIKGQEKQENKPAPVLHPPGQKIALDIPKPESKPGVDSARKAARVQPAAGDATASIGKQPSGKFFAQLGSLRSYGEAETAWGKFKVQFPSSLQGIGMRVQEARLGERGTYYRVQAGPVAESKARAICRVVEERRSGGCLVVHR